jgi:hypothetical protein
MFQLPLDLQEKASAIVLGFHSGNIEEGALNDLKNWIMNDGWSSVGEAWQDMFALDIQQVAIEDFNDKSVLNNWLEDGAKAKDVTDDDRIEWSLHVIENIYSSNDSELCPSVHTVELMNVDGKVAQLGFLVRGEGYEPVFEWFDLFKTKQDFYEHLTSKHGYVVSNGEDDVDQALILKLWDLKKNKKR